MRRLGLWIFVALLLMAALPHATSAQGGGVSLEATALYEGTSKYGEWLPVSVTLTNEGNDVRGTVQIQVTGADNATSYAQATELARGARKVVTLYIVPNNFARRLQIEFIPDGQDEPIADTQVTIRPVPTIRYVAAAISPEVVGLESIAGVNFRGERQDDNAVVVPLDLAQLPERPEALRTLDLLIITGTDTSTLTARQQAALEQFVALGGVLVLGGGSDAGRVLAGVPENLRPVTLSGEVAADTLPGLTEIGGEEVRVNGPFPMAQGQAVAGATVRYNQEGQPLVVEKPIGDGAVVWLALDPALSPFDAWAGAGTFWQNVIGSRAYYPAELPSDVAPRQLANQELYYALQNLPSLDLPSLNILIPLLGAYILLVGPVNYFILRRQRRLELAWVTIPVITLLFSAATYGLGYGLRGSDVILNQVAIIRATVGAESAYVRSLVGLFSPSRRTYDLEIGGDALLSPSTGEYDPFSGQPLTEIDATLFQGQPARAQGVTVNQWSMRGVVAEGVAPTGYGVAGDFASGDGQIVGTITNNSDQTWEDVVVLLGANFDRVGDIAPGESKEVTIEVSTTMMTNFYDISNNIFGGNTGQPLSRENQVRQQVVSTLFTGSYSLEMGTSLVLSRRPVLLAWLAEAPLEVGIAGNNRVNSVSTVLLTSELPLTYPAGPVSFVRGTLGGRMTSDTQSYCYGPGMVSISPDFETAEVEFTLPSEGAGLDPTQLYLYITSDSMFVAPELEIFNFASDSYDEIGEARSGRNIVENPDEYLSDEGVIRVQLTNTQRNMGGCLFVDAGVDGVLPETVDSAMR